MVCKLGWARLRQELGLMAVIGKNVPWPAATAPRMLMGGGRDRGGGVEF